MPGQSDECELQQWRTELEVSQRGELVVPGAVLIGIYSQAAHIKWSGVIPVGVGGGGWVAG